MSQHDHDDLWQLLGKDRKATVSPFFARNVVREVRNLKQDTTVPTWLVKIARLWQIPALGFCAMAIAGVAFSHKDQPSQNASIADDPQLLAMVQTVSQSPDYRVIGHLDELMDSEQNSVWLER